MPRFSVFTVKNGNEKKVPTTNDGTIIRCLAVYDRTWREASAYLSGSGTFSLRRIPLVQGDAADNLIKRYRAPVASVVDRLGSLEEARVMSNAGYNSSQKKHYCSFATTNSDKLIWEPQYAVSYP